MINEKPQNRYIYRWCCMVLMCLLATAMFLVVWYLFVSEHNNTGSLLGLGNLSMASGIYFILYYLIGRALKAFRIGVDRKANLLASQTMTVFCADFIELFVSCAITGQFRYFPQFLWRYLLLAIIQATILCIITLPLVDLYRRLFKAQQILEIYGAGANEQISFMNLRPDKYHVSKSVSIDEGVGKKIFPNLRTMKLFLSMIFLQNRKTIYSRNVSGLVKESISLQRFQTLSARTQKTSICLIHRYICAVIMVFPSHNSFKKECLI